MSSSKSKGKSKAPAGSSRKDLALQSNHAAEPPAARLKIVADLPLNKIWFPGEDSLIEEPFELWTNLDWTRHIKEHEEFDAEYGHYKEIWDKAGCEELLRQIFGEIQWSVPLDQCISIGLGNFAQKTLVPVAGKKLLGETKPRKPGDHIRYLNPTLHQFVFIRQLAKFLEIPNEKVYFQDPGFKKFERDYLRKSFHERCILNPHEGEDCPSGAQDQLTPKTFLMAPMVSGVLSEILAALKAPGLYVGTQMVKMLKAPSPHLGPEAVRALKAPFNIYRVTTIPKPMPRFVLEFEWPDDCEIRSPKLKKK